MKEIHPAAGGYPLVRLKKVSGRVVGREEMLAAGLISQPELVSAWMKR